MGVVWVFLCVCTAVTAGRVSGTTTPSLRGGNSTTEKPHEEQQVLNSAQQTGPSPYTAYGYGSSMELLRLEAKLEATETKLEATEAKLEATETKLDATEAKLDATEAKLDATEAKLEATEAKLEATEAKLEEGKTKQEATERKLGAVDRKLEAMEKKLGAAEKKLEARDAEPRSTRARRSSGVKSGSTFVRWGRETCTSQSQLVYSGAAGGSSWDHSGAAANLLCLTLKPKFGSIKTSGHHALLYGAEYEYIGRHHDHDVPCAVCRTPQPTTIMIPATRYCPTGWTTQYTGYLVAGRYTHPAASEYVCLDRYPEHMRGGHRNHNGNVLYYTIAQCGSLPCPPYYNRAVVLCVVCSK